jgi:hypothetical protein
MPWIRQMMHGESPLIREQREMLAVVVSATVAFEYTLRGLG